MRLHHLLSHDQQLTDFIVLSGYHWLPLACYVLYNPDNPTDTHTHTEPDHYSVHAFEENSEMAILKTTLDLMNTCP